MYCFNKKKKILQKKNTFSCNKNTFFSNICLSICYDINLHIIQVIILGWLHCIIQKNNRKICALKTNEYRYRKYFSIFIFKILNIYPLNLFLFFKFQIFSIITTKLLSFSFIFYIYIYYSIFFSFIFTMCINTSKSKKKKMVMPVSLKFLPLPRKKFVNAAMILTNNIAAFQNVILAKRGIYSEFL